MVKFLAGSKGCAENFLLGCVSHFGELKGRLGFFFLFSVIGVFKYLELNCSLKCK